MTYAHHVISDVGRRHHFARLLGQELDRMPPVRPGTWAHMEAMQAAWNSAERRARGGL